MASAARPLVHVAVGVITDRHGRTLIAQRPESAHQGGRWEFPGGKVEPGEGVTAALARELLEELGIVVTAAQPLLRIPHHYPDKSVLLDVWRVTGFTGNAHGREGQPVRWAAAGQLQGYAFPDANRSIVRAACLPPTYLITAPPRCAQAQGAGANGSEETAHNAPGAVTPADQGAFVDRLRLRLEQGQRLVQLRAHTLSDAAYAALAEAVAGLCREHGAQLLLNGPPALARALGVGLHLTSRALAAHVTRPLPEHLLLAASCHGPDELGRAVELGVDFAVLGPVHATASHPGAGTLGFAQFARWIRDVPIPVYALGGMTLSDLEAARNARAQGIAGISGLF